MANGTAPTTSAGTCACGDCVICLASHPAGKTCRDCAFFKRCTAFLGITGAETHCDRIPSKFYQRKEAAHV